MAQKMELKPEEKDVISTLQMAKVGYTSAEQHAFQVMDKSRQIFDKAILG